MYVYLPTEDGKFITGFFSPRSNDFVKDEEYDFREDAASRVNYLNGGSGAAY
jgi:hypothetical protein